MSELLEKIAAGCTVLTVNSRLALHLHKDYEVWQRQQGNSCWATPAIIPWGAWLQQQWQEAEFHQAGNLPVMLTAEQSQAVWEAVIQSSDEALLNIPATARSAMQAWRLLQQWNLAPEILISEDNLDSAAFYRWAKEFRRRCQTHNWLDEAALPTWLCQTLQAGELQSPQQVLLFGFDELTPQHQSVIEALQVQGTSVELIEPKSSTTTVVSLQPCADSQSEIREVALWLRHLLEQGVMPSAAPIGIVVPDLSGLRGDIERIFDEVLMPATVLELNQKPIRPYNISLGQPMAQLPVIHAALSLFDVLRGPSPLANWSRLLLSPWLGGADEELSQRALVDASLRRHGEATLSLKQVLYHADKNGCELLTALLLRLQQSIANFSTKQSPDAWVNSFQLLLQQAGWPGDRSLDSGSFQTIQAWKKMLSRFASLSQVTANLSFSQALKQLRQLANSTLFQAQSNNEPVQVLGVLEAAGVRFSHCWLMGLHDGVWPPATSPNPFLPIELQRRFNMPHASAERELAYAEQISKRLFAAAPEVIVSYPCREGDSDLRPSPLIADKPLLQQAPWLDKVQPRFREQLFESAQLQQYSDWNAPELAMGTQVRGGTSIFKDQAACPFRAFGRHRLNAEGLDEPELGLNAAERGNLVHDLMEKLWLELKDQQTLNRLDDSALQQLVDKVVAELLAAEARKYPQVFSERFTALEQARLVKLTVAWLELERQRAPFTVAAVEQQRQVTLAGLEMKVKADRIDQLESGGQMIIDYKTGKTSVNDWFGTRPNEPQLPLYAATSDQEVTALAFATLRTGDVALKGVSRDKNIAKGIKPGEVDWYVQQGLWLDELNRLGENFRQGQAEVDPKDAFSHSSKACMFCDLGPLCRINELNIASLDEEGVDGDE